MVKILIVEDNTETRMVLKEYFSLFEYEVKDCENGVEALKMLNAEEFTVMITDVRMPEMDGITLIKNVRKKYPRMGIILMTAFSSAYGEEDVRRIGVDDYISKPFKFDDINTKVEKLVTQIAMMKPKN